MKKQSELFDSSPSRIPVFASIFDSRSSNSTLIHPFYYSASTRLRLQSFGIHLHDKSRVGTPLRRNLLIWGMSVIQNVRVVCKTNLAVNCCARWHYPYLLNPIQPGLYPGCGAWCELDYRPQLASVALDILLDIVHMGKAGGASQSDWPAQKEVLEWILVSIDLFSVFLMLFRTVECIIDGLTNCLPHLLLSFSPQRKNSIAKPLNYEYLFTRKAEHFRARAGLPRESLFSIISLLK